MRGFRKERKFGVVGLDDCAHSLNTFSLVKFVAGSEYAPDAEADVFELNWIVLVDSPVVEHLDKLEHVASRYELLSESYLASFGYQIVDVHHL